MKLDIERVHELLLGLCTGLNKVITTTQLKQQMNEHLPKTMTSYYWWGRVCPLTATEIKL